MLRFLYLDEHELCRIGLKTILAEISPSYILDEAATADEGFSLFKEHLHSIVVLEINLSNTNVYELVLRFLELNNNCKILILSSVSEKLYAINYIKIGVKGFVAKYELAQTLKEAINAMVNNKRFFSETVIDMLLQQSYSAPQSNGFDKGHSNGSIGLLPTPKLSLRESEILRMILQGMGTKEIANAQSIRLNTVSTYKMRIFEKFNVDNIVELMQIVKQNGMFNNSRNDQPNMHY
jgi:two-component system invasion response regulator UvrY